MERPTSKTLGICFVWYPCFIDPTAQDYKPETAINEVFQYESLEGLRKSLWQMLKSAVKDGEAYGSDIDKDNLTHSFELLNDLLNACYLINWKLYEYQSKAFNKE